MNTFQNELKVGSLVRVKMYREDNYPSYWDNEMLDHCGEIHHIERFDGSHIILHDIYDWWFKKFDFEKVNTNPLTRKRRKKIYDY